MRLPPAAAANACRPDRGRRMKNLLLRRLAPLLGHLMFVADLVVPTRNAVVLRSGSVADDQTREVVRALLAAPHGRVSWLVTTMDGAADLPPDLRDAALEIVPATSLRALQRYLRAKVVLHTHGVHFGSPRRSRRKFFINLWHGMPVKRLDRDLTISSVQTDATVATSPVHAGHLADTWGLRTEQVLLTGLPRNDALLRAGEPSARAAVKAGLGITGPLVVWLPTYRRLAPQFASFRTGSAVDGHDFGNPFELPGADTSAVAEAMTAAGATCILKVHPMAAPASTAAVPGLRVWTDTELRAAGLTLYELLGAADVLVTDYSSVWIDFLLADRPMIFCLPDVAEYAENRGFYFEPLEQHVPGPVATNLDELVAHLTAALADPSAHGGERERARAIHHLHTDAASAARVRDVITERLAGASAPRRIERSRA